MLSVYIIYEGMLVTIWKHTLPCGEDSLSILYAEAARSMVFGRKLTEKNWLGEQLCLAAMLAAVSFTMKMIKTKKSERMLVVTIYKHTLP